MLTPEKLRYHLKYNAQTGEFIWISPRANRHTKGDVAGCTNKINGYRDICLYGVLYKAHRLAWLYEYGEFPKDEIDHINHIKDDNRISNLREATRTENNRNASLRKDNKSGYSGVEWYADRKKWRTRIRVDGASIHIGMFEHLSDAVKARHNAEKENGFHVNHGGAI